MTAHSPFSDRVALITGPSSGIGKATTEMLAEHGADVALVARSEGALTEVASNAEGQGVDSLVLPTDVSEEDEVKAAIDRIMAEFGQIDIVVNNAGVAGPNTVEEMPTEAYRKMINVNLTGVFFVTRETIPHLRETHGNLIFIGSMAGEYPRPTMPVYAATKWWIRGFGLSLSGRLGEDDVGVTIVNPTEVATDLIVDGQPMSEHVEAANVSTPADVAEAICFAAKQEPPNTVTELDFYRRDKLSHF